MYPKHDVIKLYFKGFLPKAYILNLILQRNNIKQIPVEGYLIKYLKNTPQKHQIHQKQGNLEKLSQLKGTKDMTG